MVHGVQDVLTVSGFDKLPIVMAETGWPKFCGQSDAEANPTNAHLFWNGIVACMVAEAGVRVKVKHVFLYRLLDPVSPGLGRDDNFAHTHGFLTIQPNWVGYESK
ncbi:unnamed protein product [Linum trigynum]|uniref:Glucan endo-1,3-beta-D-glucosidase n=1 Tax=Linum trigynum TaxID=586398 RepID=A0AAV2CJM6_9ROSI